MELSHAPGMPSALGLVPNDPAIEQPDQMDIDMDIDLGPIDDKDILQPTFQQPVLNALPEQIGSLAAQEPQVDAEDATPHKIHIRGLDDLTTDHIKDFTLEHFPSHSPGRIEWIDDTSANIVFGTPAVALKALEQLTHPSYHGSLPELQLRPAKKLSAFPDSTLEIRLALVTDQKQPRAYEASRFYMMHPELDPREQRRKGRKRLERNSDYRRRRYGQDEHRRRRQDDRDQGFEPTMYDDDSGALASRNQAIMGRRDSASTHSTNCSEIASSIGERHRYGGRGRPERRDRSASPSRYDDDGVHNVSGRRIRRRTPPRARSSNRRSDTHRDNAGKELFPSKPAPGTALNGASKELFPNKQLAANLKRELFPSKAKASHHRRSDAFDAADETANLFAKRLDFTGADTARKSIKVVESSYGRLNAHLNPNPAILDSPVDDGLIIRGLSKQHDQGFSIWGIAADGTRIGTVKELFPGKAGGNAGKELFAEKLQGRGGRRNKAEDMFY